MTNVQIVQTLLGDPTGVIFTTAAVTQYLQVTNQSLYMACCLACNAQGSVVAANLQEVRIGDFVDSSGKNQVTALRAQADAWKQLEYDTPAWAIIEENLSDFNALILIRNYVLRTCP
jgi:hypothetical protein